MFSYLHRLFGHCLPQRNTGKLTLRSVIRGRPSFFGFRLSFLPGIDVCTIENGLLHVPYSLFRPRIRGVIRRLLEVGIAFSWSKVIRRMINFFARLCTCFKNTSTSESSSLRNVPVPLHRVTNVRRGENHPRNCRKSESPSPETPQDRGLGTILEESESLSGSVSDIVESFF